MKSIEFSYAQNHLAELLERVKNGEKIVIRQGKKAAAKLIPIKNWKQQETANNLPRIILHPENTFVPLSEAEMQELGIE